MGHTRGLAETIHGGGQVPHGQAAVGLAGQQVAPGPRAKPPGALTLEHREGGGGRAVHRAHRAHPDREGAGVTLAAQGPGPSPSPLTPSPLSSDWPRLFHPSRSVLSSHGCLLMSTGTPTMCPQCDSPPHLFCSRPHLWEGLRHPGGLPHLLSPLTFLHLSHGPFSPPFGPVTPCLPQPSTFPASSLAPGSSRRPRSRCTQSSRSSPGQLTGHPLCRPFLTSYSGFSPLPGYLILQLQPLHTCPVACHTLAPPFFLLLLLIYLKVSAQSSLFKKTLWDCVPGWSQYCVRILPAPCAPALALTSLGTV